MGDTQAAITFYQLLASVSFTLPVRFLVRRQGLPGSVERLLAVLAPLLYLLVGLAAFVPGPEAGLAPLQIEGFVVAAVFLLGLTHAWRALAEAPARVATPPH